MDSGGTTEQTRNANERTNGTWANEHPNGRTDGRMTELTNKRSTERSPAKTNERKTEWTNPRNEMNSWTSEWTALKFVYSSFIGKLCTSGVYSSILFTSQRGPKNDLTWNHYFIYLFIYLFFHFVSFRKLQWPKLIN